MREAPRQSANGHQHWSTSLIVAAPKLVGQLRLAAPRGSLSPGKKHTWDINGVMRAADFMVRGGRECRRGGRECRRGDGVGCAVREAEVGEQIAPVRNFQMASDSAQTGAFHRVEADRVGHLATSPVSSTLCMGWVGNGASIGWQCNS